MVGGGQITTPTLYDAAADADTRCRVRLKCWSELTSCHVICSTNFVVITETGREFQQLSEDIFSISVNAPTLSTTPGPNICKDEFFF